MLTSRDISKTFGALPKGGRLPKPAQELVASSISSTLPAVTYAGNKVLAQHLHHVAKAKPSLGIKTAIGHMADDLGTNMHKYSGFAPDLVASDAPIPAYLAEARRLTGKPKGGAMLGGAMLGGAMLGGAMLGGDQFSAREAEKAHDQERIHREKEAIARDERDSHGKYSRSREDEIAADMRRMHFAEGGLHYHDHPHPHRAHHHSHHSHQSGDYAEHRAAEKAHDRARMHREDMAMRHDESEPKTKQREKEVAEDKKRYDYAKSGLSDKYKQRGGARSSSLYETLCH